MRLREHLLFAALVTVAGIAAFACLNFFIAIGEPSLVLSQPPPLPVIIGLVLVAILGFATAPDYKLALQGVCNGMVIGFILCVLEVYASNTQEAEVLRYRLFWHDQIHLVSWYAFGFVVLALVCGFISGLGFFFGRKLAARPRRKRT